MKLSVYQELYQFQLIDYKFGQRVLIMAQQLVLLVY